MKRTSRLLIFLIVASMQASGCSRHYVVERDAVESMNDTSWTVHSEPVDSDADEQ